MAKRPWSEHRHEPWWTAFCTQRFNAIRRRIEWKLEPLEWWMLWLMSGKWDQRGRLKHQYCMARVNDSGSYAIGNVMIITNAENHEMAVPVPHTEEFKRALSKRSMGNKYGQGKPGRTGDTLTTETREKISEKSKALWKNKNFRERVTKLQRQGRRQAYLQGKALKKLTIHQVREIRALAKEKTQKELAEQFGITQSNISEIINRGNFDWLK